MNVHLVGLNHRSASLEIREKLAFSKDTGAQALDVLRSRAPDVEWVLLSTCNRTELYAAGEKINQKGFVLNHLAGLRDIPPSVLEDVVYHLHEQEAVQHLFRVTASLDSMILGETQVLAQVKEAFQAGLAHKTVGRCLHPLFQSALHTAKLIHTRTDIAKGRTSIASIAVSLVEKVFQDFSNKCVLVVGSGETAELVLVHLKERKIGKTLIANRTRAHAEELAKRFGGQTVDFEVIGEHIREADVVISSTAAPGFVIKPENIEKTRNHQPLVIMDIAVPRDVDPRVGALAGVYQYNIDDLQNMARESSEAKSRVLERCLQEIDRAVELFHFENRMEATGSTIAKLRGSLTQVGQQEMAWLATKLADVSERDVQKIEQMTRRLLNKIVHRHINVLRDAMQSGDGEDILNLLEKLSSENQDRKP